jgi:ribosomal protein S18 acetylase RimI-like enzyme
MTEEETGPAVADDPPWTIESWDPAFRDAFRALNVWWLERWFEVEPIDLEVLDDPEGTLLAHGGEIWFAVAGGRALGTCALKDHGEGRIELTKLGVDPSVHGGGMGQALSERIIERFVARGGRVLFLETNTVLEPAIKLYEKLGFVELPNPVRSPYERSNYYMEWRPEGR